MANKGTTTIRSNQWAAIALDADQVDRALLTLLWLARGQLLAAESDGVRSAAQSALEVAQGAVDHHRQVRRFLAYGQGLAEEREHDRLMEREVRRAEKEKEKEQEEEK